MIKARAMFRMTRPEGYDHTRMNTDSIVSTQATMGRLELSIHVNREVYPNQSDAAEAILTREQVAELRDELNAFLEGTQT